MPDGVAEGYCDVKCLLVLCKITGNEKNLHTVLLHDTQELDNDF